MNNSKLLEKFGWVDECQSPLEIRHEDGSFASGQAAYIILSELKRRVKGKKNKKSKMMLEKDLKNWDVFEAPTENFFIKINDSLSIAIGHKGNCVPDKKSVYCENAERFFDKYTLPCVETGSGRLEVKKVGKVKFKK